LPLKSGQRTNVIFVVIIYVFAQYELLVCVKLFNVILLCHFCCLWHIFGEHLLRCDFLIISCLLYCRCSESIKNFSPFLSSDSSCLSSLFLSLYQNLSFSILSWPYLKTEIHLSQPINHAVFILEALLSHI
jgi:hypothetical protein